MESLPPSVINRKWLLCALASFLGFLLLSSSLRRASLPTATIESLTDLQITAYYIRGSTAASVPDLAGAPVPDLAGAPVPDLAGASVPDLAGASVPAPAPQPVAATSTSSAPSSFAPVTNSSSSSSSGVGAQTLEPPSAAPEAETTAVAEKKRCDVFDGRWVYDRRRYPLYQGRWCPFLSEQVSCQKNGRPDSEYEHWRWQPNGCDLPRLKGSEMLERLRGKRVVMVGDSLNRNMWESLACILYSALSRRPKRAVVQVHSSGYKLFHALDYECRVEFYWSPFLVELKEREGHHAKILRLDKLPLIANRWLAADIIIFNTGHCWTHQGKMRAWNYFEHRDELMVGETQTEIALDMALTTWARWVDSNIDRRKTAVFFRSISPEHNSQNWCYNRTNPITTEPYVQLFPSSIIRLVERTIDKMMTPVTYLNITRLSEYRQDGHTAVYTSRQGKLLTPKQ